MTGVPDRGEGRKPRLLDLFCGAGGCARGYQRAGFYVVGVDIEPQPRYAGDEFVQGDALDVLRLLVGDENDANDALRVLLPLENVGAFGGSSEVGELVGVAEHRSVNADHVGHREPPVGVDNDSTKPAALVKGFDAIHASPPCQWYSFAMKTAANAAARERHKPMIAEVRELLMATRLPYVIENVEGARKWMVEPIMLCGSSFDLHVRRHRLFESTFPILAPPCAHGQEWLREARYITTTRRRTGRKEFTPFVNAHATGARFNTDDLRDAMGVDWMVRTQEIREAIPPAYTELIGHQLLQHLRMEAQVA